MIALDFENDVVSAGELLRARVRWSCSEGRRVRRIIIAAEWETDGTGDRMRGVGRSTIYDPKGAFSAEIPVRLLIPFDGPISYRGTLFTIDWQLHVRVDRPGLDEAASAPFRVMPRRRRELAEEQSDTAAPGHMHHSA